MKKIFVVIVVLFLFQAGVPIVAADFPPFTEYIVVDGTRIKLDDGLDLSSKDLRGITIHYYNANKENIILLENIDFSGSNLDGANIGLTEFDRSSFRGAKLTNMEGLTLLGNNDLTDAEIENVGYLTITGNRLIVTAPFQRKALRGIRFGVCPLQNVDFSGFDFQKVNFGEAILNGCNFTDAVIGEGCILGSSVAVNSHQRGMLYEQLQTTKSYKEGKLINVSLNLTWPEGLANFSKMNLTGCYFGSGGTYSHVPHVRGISDERSGWSVNCQLDITDSVITDCGFIDFKGLTLENIKSTWNYKHGRMEGIKLPEEIQKALDAEKEQ